MGDARRFSSSAQAVRHTGLDVTVYSSDDKRTPGHLSHQGPPILRWALFEAGHQGSRAASPDHRYYTDVAARIDANRAALPVAASSPAAPTTSGAAPATPPAPPCRAGEADAGERGGPHATDAPRPSPVAGVPELSCSPPPAPPGSGQPRKTGAATPQRDHPIDHHAAGTSQHGPVHRDKAGRPRHPHQPNPELAPEEPMT